MSKREVIYARGRHPNSLAQLKPVRPGEVLNPTGKTGENCRIYSQAIQAVGSRPLPEYLRMALNHRFKNLLAAELRGAVTVEEIPDMYRLGISWAEANALRLHVSSVLNGDINAAVECREASEGRATTRVEFISQNDKLEQLLEAFRKAAEVPVDEPGPQVVVQ